MAACLSVCLSVCLCPVSVKTGKLIRPRFVAITHITLCKKVRHGKKSVWKKKNLEIKTLGKKSEFFKVLGKNVTRNKVLCFGFLGLFS